jgi:formamidopyrimidine-DNA glycosylase
MPELPDVTVYIEALAQRIQGARLDKVRLFNPFLLRTAVPPIASAEGKRVTGLRRLGKRVVIGLEAELFLVLHLMIAGRLHWAGKKTRSTLALFEFDAGTLSLTEAGSKRRASLHLVEGEAALRAMDPGGIEIFESDLSLFREKLTAENHTLKRALTDPRLFSGIGNAYSDEILHAAKMSPMLLTSKLTPAQIEHLHAHTIGVLTKWRDQLIGENGDGFPEKVTAFRDGMAAHGRYGKPCPVCGTPIQRIQYASNEANYCPTCQTGGKLLADRGLSRLLKDDWPKSLEELERRKAGLR